MSDTLTGYAIVWNRWSLDLGGFREKIAPSAIERTLRDGEDLRALWSHRPDELLGRLSANTLRVAKDAYGLVTEITLPETRGDIAELVRRRDVTGMSFGFMTLGDLWEEGPVLAERTITDMLVREVSPVVWPAYPSTTLSLRQALAPGALRKSSTLRLRPWTVTARLEEPMEHRGLEYAMARDGEGTPVIHGEARRSLERYLEAKRKAGAPPESRTAWRSVRTPEGGRGEGVSPDATVEAREATAEERARRG
jgi:HK97 family phage prohead protease